MKTFSRGIHPKYFKQDTADKAIVEAAIPKQVVIPLHQHTGASCEPLVKPGDEVLEGQKIGESAKFVSAPVHASIFGKVVKIDQFPHPCGVDVLGIMIEGAQVSAPVIRQKADNGKIEKISPDQIRAKVKEAGIVGLGGAAFPTHIKLDPPKDKLIDTLIVNGCECEPYITADHRLLMEKTREILLGAKLAAKTVQASRIIFGVESNKKNAIKLLRNEIRVNPQQCVYDGIEVVELETKYPQGAEKLLIKALLNREVPTKGLPMDVNAVVVNIGTCLAIYEAIYNDQSLIKRVVTVAGDGVKNPQNLMVRIGTSFKELIDQCGGLTGNVAKVIAGGPMMGIAQINLEVPVVKATSSILVLTDELAKVYEESSCIRCGRCIKSCPMGLMPNFIADNAKLKNWQQTQDYNVLDCIECGCCAFVCPSRIYLVQYFKEAKQRLMALR